MNHKIVIAGTVKHSIDQHTSGMLMFFGSPTFYSWFNCNLSNFGLEVDFMPKQRAEGIKGFQSVSEFNCSLSPVPAMDEVSLRIESPETGFATISVIDIQGREVLRVPNIETRNGVSNMSLDVSSLQSGAYYLTITTPVSTVRQQLLIIK